MSEDSTLAHFELQYSGSVDGVVPVNKYRAKESGVRIVVAKREGTLVNGVFCLATEAHDDDGIPQALKNMILMGSEDYPYKNVMSQLRSRGSSMAVVERTNTDHTQYSFYTAGFLNLMPVYLDHILFPTLKESSYVTEIHHINGEGEDGGEMYCNAKSEQSSGSTTAYTEMMREMYPGNCGYKSVTAGVMKNLRESTSLEKVKSYHAEFYRPENLCIIVAGMVEPLDVLKAFLKFEEKIARRQVDRPVYVRPWQRDVPPLSTSVELTIQYPCDDDERRFFYHGLERSSHKVMYVKLGTVNPALLLDQNPLMRLEISMCREPGYSVSGFYGNSEIPTSKVNQAMDLTEEDNYLFSKVWFYIEELSSSCVYIRFDDVPSQKLKDIKAKLLEVLESLCESVDMREIQAVIRKQILNTLLKYEERTEICMDSAFKNIVSGLVQDFLYGISSEDTDLWLKQVSIMRDLLEKPVSYWRAFIKKYFVDSNHVAISAVPSPDLKKEIEEAEKKRVAEQKEKLKVQGLAEKQKLLELAIKEKEIQPPAEFLARIPTPSLSSVLFRSVKSSCNYTHDSSLIRSEKFPLDEIPISFQLDDINSNFGVIKAVMDSSGISEELRRYLRLYTAVVLQSSILRNETLISCENVIKELDADTICTTSSIGEFHFLSCITTECGLIPSCVMIKLWIEREKYEKGVLWLHELLYEVQFDVERLKVAINEFAEQTEDPLSYGGDACEFLLMHMNTVKGCNERLMSIPCQRKFLMEMLDKLNSDPNYATVVLEKLNELKVELTDPARLRVHMSAHVDRLVTQTGLSDAVSVWSNVFLPSAKQKYRVKSSPLRNYQLQKPYPTAGGGSAHGNLTDSSLSLIAGLDALDSTYLNLTTPCLTEFRHADVPAIMMFIEYIQQSNGSLYNEIYDQSLASSFGISLELDSGLLKFHVSSSPNIVDVYRLVKKTIVCRIIVEVCLTPFVSIGLHSPRTYSEKHTEDGAVFDTAVIESCKLRQGVNIAHENETVSSVTRESLLAFLRGTPHGYNRWLLDKIPEVSSDDLRRVSKLYFTSLFSPTQSKLAICTKSDWVDEICQKFKAEFGRELTVMKSLEEPYLINM